MAARRRRAMHGNVERLERRILLAASLLKDINTATDSSNPSYAVSFGGDVYFEAFDPHGYALWKTDGTLTGTHKVGSTNPSSAGYAPQDLTPAGNKLFFFSEDATSEGLYVSDGTDAGTAEVLPLGSYNLPQIAAASGKLFFVSGGAAGLWVSDGTSSGTVPLTGTSGTAGTSARYLTAVGNLVYFTADDGSGHMSLWKSDGTVAGTIPVADFPQFTPTDYSVTQLVGAGDRVYFGVVSPNPYVRNLWASDGTAAGTRVVSDLHAMGMLLGGRPFAAIGNELLFSTDDGLHGSEPWVSDGTSSGTHMLLDINTAISGSLPSQFTFSSGQMYFSANDGVHGRQLWKTDGTPDGTMRVIEGDLYTNPSNLTDVNGTLYFVASGGLFKTDGTTAGTVGLNGFGYPTALVSVNGTLYFITQAKGPELARTDGTTAGTKLLFPIPQGPRPSDAIHRCFTAG